VIKLLAGTGGSFPIERNVITQKIHQKARDDMYLSRMQVNSQLNSYRLIKELHRNRYREHKMLWHLFDTDPSAKRDFLYRQTFEQGQMRYYILSKRKPVDKNGIWHIEGPKGYNPILKTGQRLFFMLRANPVVTMKSKEGKRQRHDVVMHEKQITGYGKIPVSEKFPLQKLIQDKCSEWLNRRAVPNGFEFKDSEILVDGYQQHKTQKTQPKNRQNIHYSTVDFQGILTVIDPKSFKEVLTKGIGKSKAFGCGLILIKKI